MATAKTATKPAAKSAPLNKKPAEAKASTSVAVRKPAAGAVSIRESMAERLAKLNERTAPASGNKIKTKDKKFTLPDGTETTELQLVVVDFISTHKFYEGKYDPKNIVPPGCFAIGINPRQMTPSSNAPNKQADSCQGCPMNEFGSDGDGKACKNGRTLAVLPPDADDKTELMILEVSPTAIKAFDGFVNAVSRTLQTLPVGVVVTVGFDDTVTYPKLTFRDPVYNENVEIHDARSDEARALLEVEPDVSGYQEPAKAPARKGAPARR